MRIGVKQRPETRIGAGLYLIFVQIFAGNIILRHFMSVDFALVPGVLHALHHVGLEGIPFFEEFIHAL